MAKKKLKEEAKEEKEIDILEDGSSEDSAEVEAAGDEKEEINTDDVIAGLKKQVEDKDAEAKSERELRIKAERERGEAATKASSAVTDALAARGVAIDKALEAANSEVEKLEREMEEALEKGDNKTVVALNRKLSAANVKLIRTEEDKGRLEEYKEKIANAPQEEVKVSDAAQDWINAHPRFNTDPLYNGVAMGAHHDAIERKKLKADSPEYFAYIEKALAKQFDEEEVEEEEKPKKKQQSFAAPPSRESYGASSDGTKYRLSAAEMEAAETCGMTPEEYAREKLNETKAAGRA